MTASLAGLFGLTAGFLALLIHLSRLTCMDVAYLAPFSGSAHPGILRRRLFRSKFRDPSLSPQDGRNQR